MDFLEEENPRIPVIKLEHPIKGFKNPDGNKDRKYADKLAPLRHCFYNKKPKQEIGQEFEHLLKGHRGDERKAHELGPGKINGIVFLKVISTGRKEADQEFGQRNELNKNKAHKPGKEMQRPLQRRCQKITVLRLLPHQNVGQKHDQNGQLNRQD